MKEQATYDTLHMGRSSIDLYSNDVGAAFVDIKSFAAYVGGSPTNISVGVSRLGLRSALLTGLGEDPVGDFIHHFLDQEGVFVACSPRKGAHRSSAVVLGIEPPDRFPLVFYRDHCADRQLSIDDALAAPLEDCRIFQFAGTNLSHEPSRSATLFAAERARAAGALVVLDLDFRPDQWHDPRAFGVAVRGAMRLVDIVIGTETELNAATMRDAQQWTHSASVSESSVQGDADGSARELHQLGPHAVAHKRGHEGVRLHLFSEKEHETVDVPGFPVEVQNVLGAGDAFAAGFLYGLIQQWDWVQAARLGNACGAFVVTQHGCANFMPTYDEIIAFCEPHGGL